MKSSSLRRMYTFAAPLLLAAWPSLAEDRAARIPSGGACTAVSRD